MTTYKIVMIRHGEKLKLKDSIGSWCDRQLTARGEEQAGTAGRALAEAGYQFDVAHTSELTRAQVTLDLALRESGQPEVPVEKTWRLNSRHWSESRRVANERTLEYWNSVIVPQLKSDKKILIAAHGGSLRAIIQHLDSLTDAQRKGLKIPNGVPFIYELDQELKPLVSMQFIGDEETLRRVNQSGSHQEK